MGRTALILERLPQNESLMLAPFVDREGLLGGLLLSWLSHIEYLTHRAQSNGYVNA